MPGDYVWIFYGLLSAFMSAIAGLFGKAGIEHLDSVVASTIYSVALSVLLVIFFIYSGKMEFIKSVDSTSLAYLLISALFGALSWYYYYYSLKYSQISKVTAVYFTSLIFIVFLEGIFLGETLSFKVLLGALLMSIGTICIVW